MIPIEMLGDIADIFYKMKKAMKENKMGYVSIYACIVLFVTAVLYLAGSVTSASFYINEWSFNVRALISAIWVFMLFVSGGFVSDLKK